MKKHPLGPTLCVLHHSHKPTHRHIPSWQSQTWGWARIWWSRSVLWAWSLCPGPWMERQEVLRLSLCHSNRQVRRRKKTVLLSLALSYCWQTTMICWMLSPVRSTLPTDSPPRAQPPRLAAPHWRCRSTWSKPSSTVCAYRQGCIHTCMCAHTLTNTHMSIHAHVWAHTCTLSEHFIRYLLDLFLRLI